MVVSRRRIIEHKIAPPEIAGIDAIVIENHVKQIEESCNYENNDDSIIFYRDLKLYFIGLKV